MEVIGEATNGQEAVDVVLSLRPDVVLMDMVMPIMNGLKRQSDY
jgi:NarL family two-component system response regulator LiaR